MWLMAVGSNRNIRRRIQIMLTMQDRLDFQYWYCRLVVLTEQYSSSCRRAVRLGENLINIPIKHVIIALAALARNVVRGKSAYFCRNIFPATHGGSRFLICAVPDLRMTVPRKFPGPLRWRSVVTFDGPIPCFTRSP